MPDNNFVSDLQALLLRLDDAGIDFVLVGGYAAMLHGSSLLTRGLDVCARLTPDAIEKLRNIPFATSTHVIAFLSPSCPF